MSTAKRLKTLIDSGVHRIGEIEIQTTDQNSCFILCHYQDLAESHVENFGGLELHEGPADARDISTYAEDGTYRFTKGQVNLKRGWVMTLASEQDLRLALDQFYPACLNLFLAWQDGSLEIESLRDKLNRQTGMYRFARSISDAGAQKLVQEVCGPAHQCAKKILWQLDSETPLDDSEASRFNGIPSDILAQEAIPLLCREACNHFVAECRKAAKAEFEAKSAEA
jgi:4Fe-4S iron-sulfur cluster binding domain/DR2241 stabilising domain